MTIVYHGIGFWISVSTKGRIGPNHPSEHPIPPRPAPLRCKVNIRDLMLKSPVFKNRSRMQADFGSREGPPPRRRNVKIRDLMLKSPVFKNRSRMQADFGSRGFNAEITCFQKLEPHAGGFWISVSVWARPNLHHSPDHSISEGPPPRRCNVKIRDLMLKSAVFEKRSRMQADIGSRGGFWISVSMWARPNLQHTPDHSISEGPPPRRCNVKIRDLMLKSPVFENQSRMQVDVGSQCPQRAESVPITLLSTQFHHGGFWISGSAWARPNLQHTPDHSISEGPPPRRCNVKIRDLMLKSPVFENQSRMQVDVGSQCPQRAESVPITLLSTQSHHGFNAEITCFQKSEPHAGGFWISVSMWARPNLQHTPDHSISEGPPPRRCNVKTRDLMLKSPVFKNRSRMQADFGSRGGFWISGSAWARPNLQHTPDHSISEGPPPRRCNVKIRDLMLKSPVFENQSRMQVDFGSQCPQRAESVPITLLSTQFHHGGFWISGSAWARPNLQHTPDHSISEGPPPRRCNVKIRDLMLKSPVFENQSRMQVDVGSQCPQRAESVPITLLSTQSHHGFNAEITCFQKSEPHAGGFWISVSIRASTAALQCQNPGFNAEITCFQKSEPHAGGFWISGSAWARPNLQHTPDHSISEGPPPRRCNVKIRDLMLKSPVFENQSRMQVDVGSQCPQRAESVPITLLSTQFHHGGFWISGSAWARPNLQHTPDHSISEGPPPRRCNVKIRDLMLKSPVFENQSRMQVDVGSQCPQRAESVPITLLSTQSHHGFNAEITCFQKSEPHAGGFWISVSMWARPNLQHTPDHSISEGPPPRRCNVKTRDLMLKSPVFKNRSRMQADFGSRGLRGPDLTCSTPLTTQFQKGLHRGAAIRASTAALQCQNPGFNAEITCFQKSEPHAGGFWISGSAWARPNLQHTPDHSISEGPPPRRCNVKIRDLMLKSPVFENQSRMQVDVGSQCPQRAESVPITLLSTQFHHGGFWISGSAWARPNLQHTPDHSISEGPPPRRCNVKIRDLMLKSPVFENQSRMQVDVGSQCPQRAESVPITLLSTQSHHGFNAEITCFQKSEPHAGGFWISVSMWARPNLQHTPDHSISEGPPPRRCNVKTRDLMLKSPVFKNRSRMQADFGSRGLRGPDLTCSTPLTTQFQKGLHRGAAMSKPGI
ncbi:hypothetical protein DFH06DRAFT_1132112 [Mycena polygramma]|nr:hypothetical protein DFH06DRAFT_1132112 [Mycena polygramma]